MAKGNRLAVILLHLGTGVLALFGVFLGVNLFLLARLPSAMEAVIGRTTADIAAYHEPLLVVMLTGLRMWTLALLVYCVALAGLTIRYGRGDLFAGRLVFAMQGCYLPLAIATAIYASLRSPWPVWAISGAAVLTAYALHRRHAAPA